MTRKQLYAGLGTAPLSLRAKQSLFTRLLGDLVWYVYQQGWELTLGDGYRPDGKGHMPNSLHYVRLAQDLNLFVDGKFVSEGGNPAWRQIGENWENRHPLCRWGGRFSDDNHLSLEHGGRKAAPGSGDRCMTTRQKRTLKKKR